MEIDEVEQIFEYQRVIHGAAFVVSAVTQDLLGDLFGEPFQAGAEPAFGFRTFEKCAGEDQRLEIYQKVIRLDQMFDVLR